LFNLEVQSQQELEAEQRAQQEAAEAAALAAAQEGTARVLARQAAEAEAAAKTAGNGHGHGHGNGAATSSARRSGKAKPAAATAAAPAVATPSPSGTGPQLNVKGMDEERRASTERLQYSAPSLDSSAKDGGAAKAAKTATVSGTKEPSRNAPCPCGSGKKYKVCHGRPGQSL